jgi:uncharacterized protein (TIGR03000 family)
VFFRAGQVASVDFADLGAGGSLTAAPPPNTPARITVRLPADARLYVDNVLCPLTSETRTFDTPRLEAGRAYYYNLRTETERSGRTQVDTRRVLVEAGRDVTVEFKDRVVATTAQR